MNAKLKKAKKVSVLFCCVSLLFGAAAGRGAAEQGSILERVTKIEDPELGELIRQALGNSPELANDQAAKAALVKRVTEAYLQIKMLDSQIAETDKRIESPRTTEAIRAELTLVRTELETKLLTQLAELRETMKLVPEAKYKHPVEALDTWLALDVIGDNSVCVYKYSEPFYERDAVGDTKSECRLDKTVSGQEAVAYVKDLIESKKHFPLRLDIFKTMAGIKHSSELKKQIDRMVEDAKLDMNPVEVYLDEGARGNMHVAPFVLRQGTRAYWRNKPEVGGPPEDFLPYFTDICLKRPRQLPLRVYVEFDEESKDVAQKFSNDFGRAASELGVRHLVNVEQLRYAFGKRKPVEELNSWLLLDVIGDVVYVLRFLKTYYENEGNMLMEPVKVMSPEEAIAHVQDLVKGEDNLPLRVDIARNQSTSKSSEELFKEIVRMAKDAKVDTELEVYLDGGARSSVTKKGFVLKKGKGYEAYVRRGRADLRPDELAHEPPHDAELLLNIAKHPIRRGRALPHEIYLAFDHESKDLAAHMVEGLRQTARESGVEQFVKIEAQAVEDVNSWLALDVIVDDFVALFQYSKPYYIPLRHQPGCQPLGVMTQAEAIEYVKEFVKSEEQLPLIVDVHRNQATIKTSEEIYKQISQMVEDIKIEKYVAVYLDERVYPGLWRGDMTLKQGKAYWRKGKGSWDPQDLISHMVEWDIARPGCCPFKLTIKFDHESKDLATKMAEATKKAAAELGVEQFVEIELKESEP